MQKQQSDATPHIKIMNQDRTLARQDIVLAKRRGEPVYEVSSHGQLLEYTPRPPNALKSYDKALTARMFKVVNGEKYIIREKVNGREKTLN